MESSTLLSENQRKEFVNSLTSKERINIFKKNKLNLKVDNKYIEDWNKRKSIVGKESFLIKLKNEGFTEEEFNYAIKELDEDERKNFYYELQQMDWYKCFKNIIEFFKDLDEEKGELLVQYDMTYAIRPFIYWASFKIKEVSEILDHVSLSDSAFQEILQSIALCLIRISQKSLTIELHIVKNQKGLAGDTPEERFKCFIRENFTTLDSLLNFYSKYSTLTRILTVKTLYFVNHITEALIRLNDNVTEIEKKFDIDINNKFINEIKCNEGDSHQKGKAVIQFIFEGDNKIIYKPRNLEVTQSYNTLIKWFNEKSGLLKLPVNEGIYKKEYTFEKFVDYKSCNNEDQVKNYYIRFGEIVAIMHILCANDFHLENIIANGEYPDIIDLETLFQQVIPLNLPDTADIEAKNKILDSVLITGMLPFIAFRNNLEGKGIDISGLNGGEQKLPYKILAPTNFLTDEMRYEYKEYIREGSNNLPMLDGKKVKFNEYSDLIIKGFEKTCKFIIQNKNLLIGDEGILNIFKGKLVRQIMKGTQKYDIMLNFSYHPSCTKNFLDREKLYENLWGFPYKNKEIIKYEIQDMNFDDIPIFFIYPDSKNLICSNGEIIKDYFDETSFDRTINRIKKLDDDEVQKQVSYMLISFGEYENVSRSLLKKSNELFIKSVDKVKEEYEINFLDESVKLAEHILEKAVFSKDKKSITWDDVIYTKSGIWETGSVDEGLYNGLSGIALYFHELYKFTGEQKYLNVSKTAIDFAAQKAMYVKDMSSFTGRGALLFTLLAMHKDNNIECRAKVDEIIKYIADNVDSISSIDWMSGAAGLIQNILNSYDVFKDERYLELAEKIGINMMKQISQLDASTLLGGMAHGTSGICFSLFKLGSYTNNNSFVKEAVNMLSYDRGLFDKEKGVWVDKRKADGEAAYKWCHGSTAIGLSRLMLLKYYRDDEILSEIELAVNMATRAIKEDDCLCHGNFGDIDFLLCYYELTNNKEVLLEISKKIKNIFSYNRDIGSFRVKAIPYFVPVSLFTGLSGIGYELLRLYDYKKVPSILKLDINY
jgi:type 2 lantibiotic biosynthesis protein LanM